MQVQIERVGLTICRSKNGIFFRQGKKHELNKTASTHNKHGFLYLIPMSHSSSHFLNSPQFLCFPQTAHTLSCTVLLWSLSLTWGTSVLMMPDVFSCCIFPFLFLPFCHFVELVCDTGYTAFFLRRVVSSYRAQYSTTLSFSFYYFARLFLC